MKLFVCVSVQLKREIAVKAEKRTNRLTWVGLGLMGLQFGLLARLTWWEYSWDIMEPVTYFVGYGSAILMFGYYILTRQVLCVSRSLYVCQLCARSTVADYVEDSVF